MRKCNTGITGQGTGQINRSTEDRQKAVAISTRLSLIEMRCNGKDNCFNRNVARKLYESKIETRININLTNLEFNSEIVINFLLQETISQSLAGRIAYLYLLPFTLTELSAGKDTDLAGRIIKGSYPPVYDQKIDPGKWYPNYIRTYVERDVRQIKNISDLNTFERFVRLCAGRSGQLLNLSSLALEAGVDSKTAGAWISVLESSFIIFRLYPWHRNFNKRIVKMPKLYFYDTGLVCSLLGIANSNQLNMHPLYGSIFENLIMSELKKHCLNRSLNEDIFFWRDNVGHEVDVIIGSNDGFIPVEIKSGKTITNEFFKGLNYWEKLSGVKSGAVVYGGEDDQNYSDGRKAISWRDLHMLFKYGSGST